nr:putative pumilio like 8, chloroplastic [Quercus suber]
MGGLSETLHRMHIGVEQRDSFHGVGFGDCSFGGGGGSGKRGEYEGFSNGFEGFEASHHGVPVNFNDNMSCNKNRMNYLMQNRNEHGSGCYYNGGVQLQSPGTVRPYLNDASISISLPRREMDSNGFSEGMEPWSSSQLMHHPKLASNVNNSFNGRTRAIPNSMGSMYFMAKDQYGCRFLQKVFDEGTFQDVEIIFEEIIGHIVELMMDPFGNYLVQKLLDVCNEEQRMQTVLMVTNEPGKLVRISLHTHGTRVVQKLVETIKSTNQISLVKSALEPGFLGLIKDLNGNHVIQRCLQCFSYEDNKV